MIDSTEELLKNSWRKVNLGEQNVNQHSTTISNMSSKVLILFSHLFQFEISINYFSYQ